MKKWFGILFISLVQSVVYAEQMTEGMAEGMMKDNGLYALAGAIAISLAVIGGAIGQGKIGSSAMEGLARNPQAQKNMFISMILGFAFIESIVIFALVIAFVILSKI